MKEKRRIWIARVDKAPEDPRETEQHSNGGCGTEFPPPLTIGQTAGLGTALGHATHGQDDDCKDDDVRENADAEGNEEASKENPATIDPAAAGVRWEKRLSSKSKVTNDNSQRRRLPVAVAASNCDAHADNESRDD